MAAPPPNDIEPRQKTALSGVFRRIANEPRQAATQPPPVAAEPSPVVSAPPPPEPQPQQTMPAPAAPVPPPRRVATSPHLLGFAEPVAHVPPIEDFLSQEEEATAAVTVGRPEVAPTAEPPPVYEPPPTLRPIRARVRDLPPGPGASSSPTPNRPRNFVERLGRQLGEVVVAPTRVDPTPRRFEPLPDQTATAPPVRRFAEPATGPATPDPAPPADRGGRPSVAQNRRLYRRAKLAAELEIAGEPCTLIDVSIGGFAATGVSQVEPNTQVPVTLRLVIDGIEVGTQLRAHIIYVTQGRSSGRFIELSPSQMAFLRYIVTWRGESIGAVGITTLLDAIAGGPERGFSAGSGDRSDDDTKSRWWAGLIGRKINPPR